MTPSPRRRFTATKLLQRPGSQDLPELTPEKAAAHGNDVFEGFMTGLFFGAIGSCELTRMKNGRGKRNKNRLLDIAFTAGFMHELRYHDENCEVCKQRRQQLLAFLEAHSER